MNEKELILALQEENKRLQKERDYWEFEAKKNGAQLGEIRILAGQVLCDE